MSLALDYDLERDRLKRRRAIAEAQLAQAQQPLGGTEQIGGIAVRRSPFEGVAKVAQAYFADKGSKDVDAQEKALGEKSRADVAAALGDYTTATTPRAATAEQRDLDAYGETTVTPGSPAYVPSREDKQSAALKLMGSAGGDPRDIAKMVVANAMKGGSEAFGKVEPKDYTPESVRAFNATGDYSVLRPRTKVEVSGGTAYDPYSTPAGSTIGSPEQIRTLKAAGLVEGTPEWSKAMKDLIAKTTSHQPGTNVDVKVNTALGTGLAGNVKDIVASTHGAAQGAVGTIDTVNRIRSALQGGNINLGPGANVQQVVDQLALKAGFGGDTTADRLVNTQQAIKGLAQFTLDARKGLKGQGQISDFEGKLLARAASGDIGDFTMPEMQAFLAVTDRTARAAYGEHERMLGVIGNEKDEAIRGLAPYYKVPPLPSAGKGLQKNPDGTYTYTPGS